MSHFIDWLDGLPVGLYILLVAPGAAAICGVMLSLLLFWRGEWVGLSRERMDEVGCLGFCLKLSLGMPLLMLWMLAPFYLIFSLAFWMEKQFGWPRDACLLIIMLVLILGWFGLCWKNRGK